MDGRLIKFLPHDPSIAVHFFELNRNNYVREVPRVFMRILWKNWTFLHWTASKITQRLSLFRLCNVFSLWALIFAGTVDLWHLFGSKVEKIDLESFYDSVGVSRKTVARFFFMRNRSGTKILGILRFGEKVKNSSHFLVFERLTRRLQIDRPLDGLSRITAELTHERFSVEFRKRAVNEILMLNLREEKNHFYRWETKLFNFDHFNENFCVVREERMACDRELYVFSVAWRIFRNLLSINGKVEYLGINEKLLEEIASLSCSPNEFKEQWAKNIINWPSDRDWRKVPIDVEGLVHVCTHFHIMYTLEPCARTTCNGFSALRFHAQFKK